MKRFIKACVKLAAVWTVAEFVTMWRVAPDRPNLKEFTKSYLGYARRETPALYERLSEAPNVPAFKRGLQDAFFDSSFKK